MASRAQPSTVIFLPSGVMYVPSARARARRPGLREVFLIRPMNALLMTLTFPTFWHESSKHAISCGVFMGVWSCRWPQIFSTWFPVGSSPMPTSTFFSQHSAPVFVTTIRTHCCIWVIIDAYLSRTVCKAECSFPHIRRMSQSTFSGFGAPQRSSGSGVEPASLDLEPFHMTRHDDESYIS